jgi:hypothetical protein
MHWPFTTPAARVKRAHLYPSTSPGQSTSRVRDEF